MNLEKIKSPFNLIIFGASGDLATLKIFPSLYELALQKRFPKTYTIYGYARSTMSEKEFREHFKAGVKANVDPLIYNESVLDELLQHVHYHAGQYDQKADFKHFAEKLIKAHGGKKVYNLAFFAVPSVVFHPIIENLAGLKEVLGEEIDLMLEKPFGEDRVSAGKLFKFITNYFKKENLFLIDHYLGKPAVRSIFPLRYNNTVLNLLLDGGQISNIQIHALETAKVDERIGFFEDVGIIKDMIQSHLLQILALLTMNMPVHQDVRNIRREKGDIISALRLNSPKDVVLGQYKGYLEQDGVKKNSSTPTFAALRLFIDLTKWYQVPIYIRTGKNLSHKHTYIVVEFKKPAYQENLDIAPNRLIIEMHPKEKIQLKLVNDLGKEIHNYTELITEESLACHGDDCLPPYAGLILDAFLGRYNSFLSIDEILASWHFIDEINHCIQMKQSKINSYAAGSEGPKQQKKLTRNDNNTWYDATHL